MSNLTRNIDAARSGDPDSTADLLPLVYDELRRLAAQRLAMEKPGHTLQPTALVHEAYLRLMGGPIQVHWNSRGHFFAAAAEAMRRILVESARRKQTGKRGGGLHRIGFNDALLTLPERSDDLLDLDEALQDLEKSDAKAAELVKLRYFTGMTIREAAETLDLANRTADAIWAYAKAWLIDRLHGTHSSQTPR